MRSPGGSRQTICVAGLSRSRRSLVAGMLGLLDDDLEIVEIDDAAAINSLQLRARASSFAICIDNPAEAATDDELALWLRFVEDILARTAGAKRVLVAWEDVVAHPRGELQRLARLVGKTALPQDPAVAVVLRRHREDRAPRAGASARDLPVGIEIVYSALRATEERKAVDAAAALSRRARVEHYERLELVAELTRLRRETAAAMARLQADRRGLGIELELLREAVASVQSLSAPSGPVAPEGPGSVVATRKEYNRLVQRFRQTVQAAVPVGSVVAVVSRGDPQLLQLDGRYGWHFPQADGGVYAGHHPADDAEAIAHLEQVRSRGASYLVFPATARWWLEHYPEVRRHLDDCHELVVDEQATCVMYRLRAPFPAPGGDSGLADEGSTRAIAQQVQELAARLLPPDTAFAVVTNGEPSTEFSLEGLPAFKLPVGVSTPELADTRGAAGAIADLEAARARGARYLVVPSPSSWWLDRHRELRQHLESRYRLVTCHRQVCSIYDLGALEPSAAGAARPRKARRSLVG